MLTTTYTPTQIAATACIGAAQPMAWMKIDMEAYYAVFTKNYVLVRLFYLLRYVDVAKESIGLITITQILSAL